MDKNVKAKLDLIKEQPQEITGGGGQWVADLAATQQFHDFADKEPHEQVLQEKPGLFSERFSFHDEESLAQVRGGVSPGKGLMKAIKSMPGRKVRVPDLNETYSSPQASDESPLPTYTRGNELPFGLTPPRSLRVATLPSEGSAFRPRNAQ